MLYLGLDCSTQSLTGVVIAIDGDNRAVVWERSVDFDAAFPQYGTRHGVLPSDDPRVAVSPPLMWAEALDRLLGELAASGLKLSDLVAIAGSAQQHGSVYLNDSAGARLAALDAGEPLAGQIASGLSRPVARSRPWGPPAPPGGRFLARRAGPVEALSARFRAGFPAKPRHSCPL